MLRPGVWQPGQFFSSPPHNLTDYLYYRLSRSRVSLRLLAIPAVPSADNVSMFERLMPHVRLSNGVYRTTFRERFSNLDPIVNDFLRRHLDSVAVPTIEDWAASACLTSVEWFKALCRVFPGLRFRASDLELFLLDVARAGSDEAFVVEESGLPLQYVRPPFVIRLQPPESRTLAVNRRIGKHAIERWEKVKGKWKLPEWWRDPNCEVPLEWEGMEVRKLPLVHPSARQSAVGDSRFSLGRHSIFDRLETPCHAIRTMNILNRAYFSDEQLLESAGRVYESLLPGGLWIVGRTVKDQPPVHEVSIFRKCTEGGLELLHRVGPGSEIEALVLGRFQYRAFSPEPAR